MLEEPIHELFDAVLRALTAAGALLFIVFLLRDRIDRLGHRAETVVYGVICGVLAVAAMLLPLPLTIGDTEDLRVLPLIFAGPAAGIPAAMVAAALATAAELIFGGPRHLQDVIAIFSATLFGCAVARAMGWPLGMGDRAERPLRPAHVLALAGLGMVAVLLPEVHWLAAGPHQHAEVQDGWMFYLVFIPGAIIAIGSILVQFAHRRRLERITRAEGERIANIAGNFPGVLYRRGVGPHGEIVFRYVSERAREMFGLDPEAMVANPTVFFSRVHPEDRARVQSAVRKAAERSPDAVITEYRVMRTDGRTVWIQTRSQVNQAETARVGETVAEGVAIDITERKEAEAAAEEARRQLRWASDHDALTHLLTRRSLQQMGAELDARLGGDKPAPPALCLVMDLRSSYLVNALFGSAGGDQRLVETARRLSEAVAPGALVARTGGDEFAIYTENPAALASPLCFVERIVLAVDKPFRLAGQLVPMRADVGYALRQSANGSWAELLQAAEVALEVARGRESAAIIAFTPELKALRLAKRALDLRLDAAVDAGELAVVWQPVVSAVDRRVLGREALARWPQADGSCIMPATFVPRAEANGLWPKLDSAILLRACREAAAWTDGLWISVNMSPGWLIVGDLVGEVRAALAATGLAPERLCIEVTERALVEDHVRAGRQIEQLREMGVGVAIDDFGSGYSSLSYMNRLPFTKVKIDKGFVDDIESSPRARYIVRSILDLCPMIGVECIAEGVETEGQLEWLRANGCAAIQGFLTGRPGRVALPQEAPPLPEPQVGA